MVLQSARMQASPAEHPSYLWTVPGKRVAVDLPLSVVRRIAADTIDALQTTGRGLEIGGLLLGRSRRERGPTVVELTGIEPLDCEHAAGPSFMLSAGDRQALEARLRALKRDAVGFYRSNTRKDFAITVEDVALMSWYFPGQSNVLLLVDAPRGEPLRGAFAVWEGRAIGQKSPADEFPFDPLALAVHSHNVAPVVAPAEPKPAPAPQRDWIGWPAAAAAVVLGAATGIGVVYQSSTPEPRPATVARAPSKPAQAQEPQPAQQPEQQLTSAPEPEPRPLPTAVDPAPPPSPTIAQAPPSDTADRRVLEPPPMPIPEAQAENLDLPMVAPPVPSPSPEPLAILRRPEPPPPPKSDAAPPAPESAVSVSINTLARGHNAKFVPPTAVQQVRPRLPSGLHLARDVQVDVRVYVDRDGKVRYAELLSNGTGENRELASLAVFTSRRWQFAPAIRDGKPVESDTILRYRFSPDAR